MHSLTSFVEFTTASTSRFQGFPLHKYIFEFTSWSTGNLDTPPPLSNPDLNVKGSGKYGLENDVSPLSYTKEWSASIHLGTWSKVTTESTLSFGNPARDVAESEVATGPYISGTLINSTNPFVKVLPNSLSKSQNHYNCKSKIQNFTPQLFNYHNLNNKNPPFKQKNNYTWDSKLKFKGNPFIQLSFVAARKKMQ